MAQDRGVPPYVIFSDATLRDLARARPTTKGAFLSVYGVGRAKADDMGEAFLACIRQYCEANDVAPDTTDGDRPRTGGRAKGSRASRTQRKAFELFAAGRSVAEVGEALARVASTTTKLLAEFIEATRPEHIDAWVPPERYRAIAAAAEEVGTAYLRPIFEQLDGAVPYDDIRLVVTHLATRDAQTERRP